MSSRTGGNSRARLLFVLVILCYPLNAMAGFGCKAAVFRPGRTVTGCLPVGKIQRHYRLFVPDGYQATAAPLPLIIGLHGGAGTPKAFERYSQFSKLAESTGAFIAVYPQGIDRHWNDGRRMTNPGIDDMTFLRMLPGHLTKDSGLRFNQRVYVVGISNGGLMALRIACEQPDDIAGIGVVAATLSTGLSRQCHPDKPVPIAFLFGSKDTSFLPDGRQVNPVRPEQLRGHHIGIRDSIAFWHTNNRCKSQSVSDRPLDRYNRKWGKWKDDHTRVFFERHSGCRAPLLWVDIRGGGHRWPDPSAGNNKFLVKRLGLGWATHEISAAKILWKFFNSATSDTSAIKE